MNVGVMLAYGTTLGLRRNTEKHGEDRDEITWRKCISTSKLCY